MFEQFEDMVRLVEAADGSTASLGILPKIAHDVITIAYGVSPGPIIASYQPLEEEFGNVYYLSFQATDTAGNMTAGEEIANTRTGWQKTPSGYASSVATVSLGTGDGVTTAFTAALTNLPILKQSISIEAGTIIGVDDNLGNIVGAGLNASTVDYATGDVIVNFDVAPDSGADVSLTYAQNLENATDIREVNWEYTSKQVKAYPYALKGILGLLKAYAMQKRFGMSGEEQLAKHLVNSLNVEIVGGLIKKMATQAVGTTNWDKKPPSGISRYEHHLTFKAYIAEADGVLNANAGRGSTSFHIAGSKIATIMSIQPGFEKLYDGTTISGAHIFGKLDGVPVVRVSDTSILANNKCLCGYKGDAFDSAAVIAPFMVLTTTDMLPMANPLNRQKAVASWTGTDVMVPELITTLVMLNPTWTYEA